eukprot:1026196-Pyramimonas_sp.AAC.1
MHPLPPGDRQPTRNNEDTMKGSPQHPRRKQNKTHCAFTCGACAANRMRPPQPYLSKNYLKKAHYGAKSGVMFLRPASMLFCLLTGTAGVSADCLLRAGLPSVATKKQYNVHLARG